MEPRGTAPGGFLARGLRRLDFVEEAARHETWLLAAGLGVLPRATARHGPSGRRDGGTDRRGRGAAGRRRVVLLFHPKSFTLLI